MERMKTNEALKLIGEQEFLDDRNVPEYGALVQNTLVDSSANRRQFCWQQRIKHM